MDQTNRPHGRAQRLKWRMEGTRSAWLGWGLVMAGMLAGAEGFADTWDPADDVPGSNATLLEPQSVEASHGPHTLSDADTADWYRIYLEAGRMYAFRANSADDMYSELYSDLTGQNMVAWNDDKWSSTQFELVYPVATSGWYSLKVRTYDGTGNASYSLLHSIWSREQADTPRLDGVATNRIPSGDYLVITGSGWGGAFGTGRDGACVLSGHANINTQSLVTGRSCPDAINYSVAALASNAAALTEVPGPGCLAAGDEVMLINLQGTAGAATNVGNYEFLRVQSVTGSNVVFAENLTRFYGNGVSDQTNIGTNATQQRVMLQRVPNYANLHSVWSVLGNAWDGKRGGVMCFRVRGRAQLNGELDMWGMGYRGGTKMVGDNTLAFQGESISGLGIQTQAVNQTGGGGGRKLSGYSAAGGGGGGHRLKGVNGGATSSGTTNGMGGNPAGDAALEKVFMGGGGGGGANTNAAVDGGRGGGIILVGAQDLEIADEGSYIDASGFQITTSNSPAGGGAGGSIRLTGRKIAIGAGTNDMVWVYGGGGGRTSPNWGGGGSAGRLAMYYQDTLQAKVGEFVCTNRRYEPVRVFMNGMESPDVIVVNPTTLAAKVPAGISGTANLKAVSADGQSSVLSNAVQVASVPPSAGGDWWSANWKFRRSLSIFNPGTQTLTNQTVTFAIPFESGMQADFDDLRFVDSAQNELPYWLAAQVNGTGTEVRVVVPLLPALQTTAIHLYFGNDAAVGGGSYQGVKNAIGTGMVSRWALDEGTGSAATNASTNAIAGTISGASWLGADSVAATGNSLRFPTGAYVDMGNAAALNFGTNDFSLSLWMRSTNRPAANTYPMLLAKEKGAAPRQGYTLMLAPTNGNVYFELFSDGSAARPSSSNSICDGRWHHVVAVRAGSEGRLFVDGRFQSAAIHPMGLFSVSNSSTFRLAGHGTGGTEMRYAGDLDEVAVYDRALAAEEVVALYEHRRVVAPAPLLTWGADREIDWPAWSLRQAFTVTNANAQRLTNYAVALTIPYAAGMQADFDDLRFRDSNGTELRYWFERVSNGSSAKVWVVIGELPAQSETECYLYYGNSFAPAGAIPAAPLTKVGILNGLVGCWHMDESGGTNLVDASGRSNHMQIVGLKWTGADSRFGEGNALDFNGTTTNYAILNPLNGFAPTQLTVSLWMKTGDTNKNGSLFSYASSISDNEILLYNYRSLVPYVRNANANSALAFNDGVWNHVAMTWDSSDGFTALYKNGTRVFTNVLAPGVTLTPGGALVLGQEQDSVGGGFDATQAFLGQMDEVRLYNRALGSNEVLGLAQCRDVAAVEPAVSWNSEVENLAWWDPAWSCRRQLTLDRTKIDADLTDFPTLVRLTTNNFDFAKAREDGFDVRFARADGTALDYERERHDAAAGKAEYWVRLPAVSSAADTEFYVYYGNSAAADGANAAGVWDGGFAGVWHFGATTNAGTRDSTVNTNHGSLVGGPAALEGKSGLGLSLNGSGSYAQCAHSPSLNISGDITLSAWVYPKTNPAAGMRVVDKMPVGTSSGYLLDTYPSNRVRFITLSNQISTATALATGAWSHVAARYDKTGGIKTIYVNGEEAQAATTGGINLQTNAQPLRFGANAALSGDWFNGLLDEVRISSAVRSPAWIKAEYADGMGTLVTVGAAEENGVPSEDGPVVSGVVDLNADTLVTDRSFADGIAYRVDPPAPGATTIASGFAGTLSNGIEAGDEILLINLQGAAGDSADVGNYELLQVSAVSATSLTVSSPVTKHYGGEVPGAQKVVVQRVPHYGRLTVDPGSTLTVSAWDGLTNGPAGSAGYRTGVLAFRAEGAVTVRSGGSISADQRGYRGGVAGGAGPEIPAGRAALTGGANGSAGAATTNNPGNSSRFGGAGGGSGGGAPGASRGTAGSAGGPGKGGGAAWGAWANNGPGGAGGEGGGGGGATDNWVNPNGGGGGKAAESVQNTFIAGRLILGAGATQGAGGGGSGGSGGGVDGISQGGGGGKADGAGGTAGTGPSSNGAVGGAASNGAAGGGAILILCDELVVQTSNAVSAVGGAGGAGGVGANGVGGGGQGGSGGQGGQIVLQFNRSQMVPQAIRAVGGQGGSGGKGGGPNAADGNGGTGALYVSGNDLGGGGAGGGSFSCCSGGGGGGAGGRSGWAGHVGLWRISGRIVHAQNGAGVPGAVVIFSNGGGRALTDENGYYTGLVGHAWSGTATPSNAYGVLSPASRSYTNVSAHVAGDDYTVSSVASDLTITGVIPESGPAAGGTEVIIAGSGFPHHFGMGTDGDASVGTVVNLSSQTLAAGRTCPDAVAYSVTGLTANAALLAEAPGAGCLAAGDEVLLLQAQGTTNEYANVGNQEYLTVAAVSGTAVTFTRNKDKYYGAAAGSDAGIGIGVGQQRVVLQRVPQYRNLSIASGGTLTAGAWNGLKGGVLAIRVGGSLTNAGTITMNGAGYRGGATKRALPNWSGTTVAWQGEGLRGLGTNSAAAQGNAGGGGNGANQNATAGGGGGGHGTAGGTAATSSCNAIGGTGGATVGSASLASWFMGGGGGGGNGSDTADGGPGGPGGGVIGLYAQTLVNTGTISASGAAGTNAVHGGGGGGGAGGSILLGAQSMALNSGQILVGGGGGGAKGTAGGGCVSTDGGAGGAGRMALCGQSGQVTGALPAGANWTDLPLGMSAYFGAQAAWSVRVLDSTSMVAVVPPGMAGTTVDVSVVRADGAYATLADGFSYSFEADLLPPAPPAVKDWLTAPQTNRLMEGLLTLSGTRSELCDVWVNGERVAGFGTEDWTFAATNLSRGVHAFDLYAMDRAGNTSEVVRLVFDVQMDKVFDVSTTLNASNNPYAGKCIMVSGATLTLNGTYAFDEVWVTNGGKIACAVAASATATNKVHLEANRIYVSTNSSIDVSGASRREYNGNSSSGGSYGGRGGYYSTWGFSGPTYGSLTEPVDMGTRSSGTPDVGLAGGVIYVKANELVLDGAIRSSGSNAPSYTGSGGSIWLDVGTLRGAGSVAANGGNGHASYSLAGSGGGRVAIYYADASGFDLNRVYAYGGVAGSANYGGGGAGTIYLKNKNEALGRVIVNNSPRGTNTAPTELRAPINAPLTVTGANVALLGNLVFTQPVTMTNFCLAHSGTLAASSLQLSSGTWTQSGAVTLESLALLNVTWNQNAFVEVTATYTHSGLTWYSGANMSFPFGRDLVVDGFVFYACSTQVWDSIVVTNGGKIACAEAASATATNKMHLEANRIVVSTNSSIDATGVSRRESSGDSNSGGSYGGRGGYYSTWGFSGPTYGSLTEPVDMGTRSSSTPDVGLAGGVIYVKANELVLDGAIRSSGSNAPSYTGSGGSVWLDVGTLRGAGSVAANGGNGHSSYSMSGGGGGRVAIYYADASGFDLNRVYAYGGTAGYANYGAGGAGTIYLKNKNEALGRVIVNNSPRGTGTAPTELRAPINAPLTVVGANVALLGNHVFTQPVTMTNFCLAHSGTLTASSLQLSSGTWTQSGAATLENLALLNVTWNQNAFVEVTATYTHSGLTWYSNAGSSFPFGRDLVVDGFVFYAAGTQTWDSIVVTNGGKITCAEAASATATNKIHLEANRIVVSTNSSIDASGVSRRESSGNSNSGGSYGGRGGYYSTWGFSGPTYGSLTEPVDMGTRSMNTADVGLGGGVIYVKANELVLDGAIRSSGSNAPSYTGSGGSVWLDVGTLRGAGSVAANGGNGHSSYSMSGSGGGRVAIYYADASEFNLNRVYAYGGTAGYSGYGAGGAGTIYLKNKNEALGRVIVNNSPRGTGTAPTELYAPINAPLTVIGANVALLGNHAFESAVIMTNFNLSQSGALAAPSLQLASGTWMQGGTATVATLAFAGVTWQQNAPVTVTESLGWSGGFTWWQRAAMDVPFGGTLLVSNMTFATTIPQTWDSIVVTNGGKITTEAPGMWQTSAVSIVARQIAISTNSSIDVSGQGWTGTNASGGVGGSHGGVGGTFNSVQPSTAYGNYLEPATPGLGGAPSNTESRGGGVIRVTAEELVLNGALRANGHAINQSGQGAGAGGSIWVDVGSLSGSGWITANGGAQTYYGGGGGGGRVAVYYREASGFNLARATALGGSGNNGGAGAAGSVHLENRQSPQAVAYVAPSGLVNQVVTSLTVRFQMPVAKETLGAEDMAISGPSGIVAVANVAEVDPITFRMELLSPLAQDGLYTVRIGPDVLATNGLAMDQDGDGQIGESADDVFQGWVTVDRLAPVPPVPGGLQPWPATNRVRSTSLTLQGTREAGTEVWVNGVRRAGLGSSAWSHELTGLAQGTNTATVFARDAAGNDSASIQYLLFVDTIPPAVSGVEPANGTFTNVSPAAVRIAFGESGTGLDAGRGSYGVTRLGTAVPGSWAVADSRLVFTPSSAWPDGTYVVAAQLADQIGNTGTAFAATFTLDSVAPVRPVVNSVTTPTTINQQTLTGWREPDTSLWRDGTLAAALSAGTEWSATVPLSPGANTFRFTSRDRAGNESPATNVVVRFNDAAPGPVTVTAAVQSTGTRLTLHWNNYDELANGGDIGEYTVYQAGQAFGDISAATAIGTRSAGQKNFVVSNLLRNATQYYAVVAADSGGMRNPSVTSIAAAPVDVVAPANPTNLRFECGRTNLTVRWDAPVDVDGDLAGYRTYLGTNGAVAVNLATRAATWTGLEPATPHPVRVGSVDATGNEGTGTNGVGITWLSNPTNVTVVPADSRLTLSWSASSPTQFVRRYLVYTGATAFASISNAGRAAQVTNLTAWVLTGLVNNATCHVAVVTENVSGGIDPQVTSLPGMPVPDAAGPELQGWTWRGEPLTNGQVLKSTGTLVANADDPAGVARLEFRISGAPQPLAATTNQTTLSNFWNVADWADGPVVLLLRGWDAHSNLMEASRSVAIELAPPSEMPTLTAPVHPTMTNATSVVLKGTVPLGYTHVMTYRNQSPLGFVAVDAQRRFETQVAVGEGANYLSAALVNRAGNGPQCSAVLVTSDQALPATPKSVAAVSRPDGEILVTWERGSLDSVAGYNLYAAPQAFASTAGVSKVNDTLLTSLSRVVLPAADGTWHYRVSALDLAGNESELSAEATAASDRVGPTATAIVYAARGAYDGVQKRFGQGLVDVDVYLSEPLMMAPYLGLTPAGGTVQSIALEEVSATRYHGVLTIDETTPSGLAYANFSARDVVGNRGTTVQTGATVRIDAQAPEVVGLSIQPAAPIGNNATNPAQIQVTVQLSETAAQAPSLSYRLSATRTNATSVALSPAGSNWVGALTLPATAGLPAESLSFAYQGEDDLGNSGGMIRAANSFEVYQGELPVLSTPYGLAAESMTGGVVRLTWEPVELAVGYRIYRRPAGAANYVEVGAVTNATVYQDLPAADGVYEYALASVRQVNQQQSISAPSQPPVSAVSDRVAPFAPSNLQLELRGTGVRLAWQAPAYTEPVQYRIYRAGGSVITNVAAATLLGGKVITLEIMDPYPSATQSVYAVTATDYVGNESPPAPSKYLNVNLLPVSTLAVEYQEGAYPLVSWTHSRSNNLEYALDVNGRTVTPPGYAGFWYVDSGYDRQEREYSIRAIDAQQEASMARTLRLPYFNLEPVASDFRRGMINVLRYRLSTTSTQAVSNVVIRAGVGGYTNVSATFDLSAGTTQEVKVVLGGRSNMLAVVPVRMQVEATPNVGELVRYVKLGTQNVGDGQFAADVYSDGLTRGGEGRIRFCLWNSGTEEVQVRVAAQSGAQASPDVRYRLADDDGNVFVTGSVKLALGSNIMTLASGDVVAMIPPGGSFLSEPVVFAIPYNVPEKLNLSMEFDRVYYHCGMPDETFTKGPLLSRPVTLHNTTYEGMVTNVAPQTLTSATNVEITGWARLSGTQTPAADVPLRLVVSVNGFDRTYTVRTDGSGSFRHVFRPGDYENGLYYVWAVHPDRLDKPLQASFVMQSVRLDYASYDLRMPTAYDQRLTLGVQAGGHGLNLTNLALVALAEDQPGGQLPAGLTFTPHLNAALASGGRINMTVGLRFAQTGSGTLVLRLASENGHGQIWQRLPVNYTVSAAQPQVWLTPSYLEAGAVQNQTIAKTITLENRGLADLLGIQLNLVQPDGSAPPAWVNLASASSIASLAPGVSQPLTVQFSPDAFVSEGVHSFQLRLTSSNAPAATYNVYAIVTRDAVGGLLFKVTDIYSGVPKANGDVEQGVYSARIQIQSESVATVKFEGYTDRQGEWLLPNLPAGAYRAKVTAAAHDEYATRVIVEPAATALVKVPLNMPLVTVQWQVQPISLTDRYDVRLAAVYSTEVPAPVVLIEPMALTLPDMKQGDVYYGQYRVVNKGLIQAEELNWIPPTSDGYIKFELLGNVPNVLKSKEEFLIPFRVTALKSFNDESASGSGSGGRCGSAYSQLNFQFQCAVKDVYEAYAISSMHYGACAMSLAEYQAALNEMYYAEWIKRALANGATINEDGSGGGGNSLSGPGGESLSPLDFLSIQGACECTCDNDGDGVKDGCYPCNGKCYQCDSSGAGYPDSCFTCDGDGDGVPDSCLQCDTDGDGKKDSCFNCDSDGDGKKDRCYLSDTDQDGIKDSCAGNCPITADNPNGDFTCDTDGDGKNDACFTCDSNGDGIKDVCFNCSTQTNGVNDSCLCLGGDGKEPVCGQCPVAAKKLNETVPDLDINKTLSDGSAKNVLSKIGKVPPAVAKVFPVSAEFSLGEFAGSGKVQWDCCEDYCTDPVKGYSIEASIGASASVKAKFAAPGFAGNFSTSVGQYAITVDWLLGGEVTLEASGQASVSREDKCAKVCEEIDATASLELRVFVGGKGSAKLVSNEVTVLPDGSQSVTEKIGLETSATVGAAAATSVEATCFGKYGSCAADPNCRTCWGGAKLEVPLRFSLNLQITERIQFTWEFEKMLYSAELQGGCE